MGTTEILARHVVETTHDSLPAEVLRAAEDMILETLRRGATRPPCSTAVAERQTPR